MAHQMDAAVQAELRQLKGNNRCVDCEAPYPQWATVSYGTFMCLECSGRHRGLGVHLSFVRSVSMDAWTEVQIRKMELGGNDQFRQALAKAGVPLSRLTIATKYNLEQAQVYRESLTKLAQLEITELPDLPRYVAPAAGSSSSLGSAPNTSSSSCDQLGVEALKGESEGDYVARQMRLKEEARARMAAKFGGSNGGGLQGIGSGGYTPESSSSSSLNSALSMFNIDSEFISSVKATSASSASSGWNALSTSASSLWKSAQSIVAEDQKSSGGGNPSAFFPRTNPNVSTLNKYGQEKGQQSAPAPARSSDFFNTPVMNPSEDPESFYEAPAAPAPAAPAPAAPAPPAPAPPAPEKKAPKVNKEDEDFFATFGM